MPKSHLALHYRSFDTFTEEWVTNIDFESTETIIYDNRALLSMRSVISPGGIDFPGRGELPQVARESSRINGVEHKDGDEVKSRPDFSKTR